MEIKDIISPTVTILIAVTQFVWFNKWFEKKKLMLAEQSKINFLLYDVHVSIYKKLIELQVEFNDKIYLESNEQNLSSKISDIRKFIGMNTIHLTSQEITILSEILELFTSCLLLRNQNPKNIIQNEISNRLFDYQNMVKQQYLPNRNDKLDKF